MNFKLPSGNYIRGALLNSETFFFFFSKFGLLVFYLPAVYVIPFYSVNFKSFF